MRIDINKEWIIEHLVDEIYYKIELEYDSGFRYKEEKEEEKITIRRYKYSWGHSTGELIDQISSTRGSTHMFKTQDITKIPENIEDLLLKAFYDTMKKYKQDKIDWIKKEVEVINNEISDYDRIIKELSFLDRENKLKRIINEEKELS